MGRALFIHLSWVASLVIPAAWAAGDGKSLRDCIMDQYSALANERSSVAGQKFIPKNGDPSLLKLSETLQKKTPDLSVRYPTVHMSSEIKGVHGGNLRILKKVGDTWWSSYDSQPHAPQGDPNWFAYIGGTKTGYFFGFRRVSPERMTVPDVREISGAIQELNNRLLLERQEPIGVRFYPSPPKQVTSNEEFLKRFAYGHAFPMTTSGPLAIHDISYHLSAVFLPNQVIEHGAQITKRLIQFVDFAKSQAEHDPKLQWLVKERVFERLVELRAGQIDQLGNFTATKAVKFEDAIDRGKYNEMFGYLVYDAFSAKGMSPDRYLAGMYGDLSTRLQWTSDWKSADAKQFSELIKTFIATHPDPAAKKALELPGGSNGVQAVVNLIDKKRGSLAKAVMGFSQ